MLSLADTAGLSAELPFTDAAPAMLGGAGTALLQVDVSTRHPQLGSGALITLKLPATLPAPIAAAAAVKLNLAEASVEWVRAPLLGGWCLAPDDGRIAYVSFLPTGLYGPGLLQQFVVGISPRPAWAAGYLLARLRSIVDGAA